MITRRRLTDDEKRFVRGLANSAAENLRELKRFQNSNSPMRDEWHKGFHRGLALGFRLAAHSTAEAFKHNCV